MPSTETDQQRRATAQTLIAQLQAGEVRLPSGRTIQPDLQATRRGTRVLEPDTTTTGKQPAGHTPTIHLWAATSTEALMSLPQSRIGLLSFASCTRVGGGFLQGHRAQEEDLLHSSTLYDSLVQPQAQAFYSGDEALGQSSVLLSPDVTFWQGNETRVASVISAAAPNLRAGGRTLSTREGAERIADRLPVILAAAAQLELDTLILGAWGCGVFGNDPHLVARAMMTAARQAPTQTVIFAVPSGPNLTAFYESSRHSGQQATGNLSAP